MARENQGLQIALIIFVMLTVILGVTTYMFSKYYAEQKDLVGKKQKEVAAQVATVENLARENEELKVMIGFKKDEQGSEVAKQFAADKRDFMSGYPAAQQYYYPILPKLQEEIEKRNSVLAERNAQLRELQKKYEVREASKDGQIKLHKTAADQAQKRSDTLAAAYKGERDRITGEQAAIQVLLQKARKDATDKLAEIDLRLKETRAQLAKEVLRGKQTTEKIAAIAKETFEVPDGEIRWVNQRNATVWINLGRGDALSRQITFSVYPADATNLTGGGKKASIEVTQILGEHLAECRVIEDKISDPIMPGDKIHTPVWSPGQQKRFALAGLMDIDGDGKSDQHIVRNLITMNGGTIDCETDASGKLQGRMTVDTRYLVLGKAPDSRGKPEVIAGYTRMIGDAERLGIKKISLGELLQQMGWKKQSPVIRFGRGANPRDFRAKPAGGAPRVSTGNVSEVFKPRRPPQRSGGAY